MAARAADANRRPFALAGGARGVCTGPATPTAGGKTRAATGGLFRDRPECRRVPSGGMDGVGEVLATASAGSSAVYVEVSMPQSSRVGNSSSSLSAQSMWLPDWEGADELAVDEIEDRRLSELDGCDPSSVSSACASAAVATSAGGGAGSASFRARGAAGVGVFARSSTPASESASSRTFRPRTGSGETFASSEVRFFGVKSAGSGDSCSSLSRSATEACSSGSSSPACAHFDLPPRTFFGVRPGFEAGGGSLFEAGECESALGEWGEVAARNDGEGGA